MGESSLCCIIRRRSSRKKKKRGSIFCKDALSNTIPDLLRFQESPIGRLLLSKPVKVLDSVIVVDIWVEVRGAEQLAQLIGGQNIAVRVRGKSHIGTVFDDGFTGDMEVDVHVRGGVHARLSSWVQEGGSRKKMLESRRQLSKKEREEACLPRFSQK